ncbi:MAG: hypothetical protein IH628_02210, partial [Proteobacteria bacterium]|nr:hypothetical protein [Pseudomonadota bacterium]
FESGSCILLDSFHGIIEFYDRLGTVIRTVRLFKEALPELERVMPFAVHTQSVSLAVSEPRRVGVRVFRFTEEGEMIFQADLAGQFASGVFLSNSGDQCAVGTTQWNDKGFEETTVLLSGDGTVWGSFPVGCIVGAFSENDSLLLVANRREQALVSVAGRRVIDRWAIAAGSLILDVNAQGNAFFVLSALSPSFVQGRWDYAHPSVVRIDSEGMRREVLTEAERHFGTAQLKNVGGELRLEIDGMLQSIR